MSFFLWDHADTKAKIKMTFQVIWVVSRPRRLTIGRDVSHNHKTLRQPTFLIMNIQNRNSSNIITNWLTRVSAILCVISWIMITAT
jgi:hypothetical protein